MTKRFFVCISIIVILQINQCAMQCPKILPRSQWDHRSSYDELKVENSNLLPAFNLIIHESSSPSCSNETMCSIQMRNILNFHMHSRGLKDIGFNFCIGNDGCVYEGRGWHQQSEGGNADYNLYSLSLCFIGTFDTILPSFRAFLTVQELILCGINKGFIAPHYALIGHRQISVQDSKDPGDALFRELKRNTFFNSNPTPIR
jgi:N-acetylmuramoyl-L-alanine amidase